MKSQPSICAFVTCFVLLACTYEVSSLAVMSVDVGSEWLKIGIVSPGIPMDIVLNKESKRKTPVVVSFRDGERLFGEDALNVAVRFPPNAYLYFTDLLGKKFENPAVEVFRKRFPYYNLVKDENRGTVLFQHDSETFYSPEELLGMILTKCKEFAKDSVQQPITEAVITVPPYFNQAERRAVMNAAELAGLKILQLINTNTAVALNYGVFRSKDFNDTAQYFMFYDMGAASTEATIVSYQMVKTKDRGVVETHPQISVVGVGYDRTLGGLEMQLRLRDYLAKAFNDMKKTKTDVFTNPRAMAKLFKEAGRLKNVLSANADHYAQVENLMEDQDFRLQVTREQFEEMCSDLFERVKHPVDKALDAAQLTMDSIDQVILAGAGTRVPKVQEVLSAHVKRDLGKSINTDEAATLGAVYRGADLSTGFKVKKFILKDAVLFPILVDFERDTESEDGVKAVKIVRRTLFSHMNPYPQKKILTFNKHTADFTFYVSYGDIPVSAEEAAVVGSKNITKIELSGVADAIGKHSGTSVDSKGVKAHFSMDESGIFSLSLIESVFEKNVTDTTEEDTLSKIGSAFSKLFSGSTDEKPEPEKEPSSDSKSDEKDTSEKSTEDTTKTKEDDKNKTGEEKKLNATAEAAAKKNKTVIVKEPLQKTEHVLDISILDGEQMKVSSRKLKDLDAQDKIRISTAKARNLLESYVIDMQNNLYMEEYEKAATAQEKEDILALCSQLSDWLYEEGSDALKEVYETKLKELKSKTKDMLDRVREHKERPEALEALDKMLNISMGFLDSSKMLPEDEQYFTEVELSTLEKLVTETLEWRVKKLEEQESTPLSETPVLTIRLIAEKIDALDREVKYMINKAKVNKLKKQRELKEKEAEKEKEKAAAAAAAATNSTEDASNTTVSKDEEKIIKSTEDTNDTKENEIPKENTEKVEPTETKEGDGLHTEL